jgi:hypothetical protein
MQHFSQVLAPERLESLPVTAMPASPITLPTCLMRMHTPQILKFNKNREYSGLLYYLLHTVAYQDNKLYPIVLHLFKAQKFIDHWPNLTEHIEEVTTVSVELAEFMKWDWNNVMVIIICAHFFVSCMLD